MVRGREPRSWHVWRGEFGLRALRPEVTERGYAGRADGSGWMWNCDVTRTVLCVLVGLRV